MYRVGLESILGLKQRGTCFSMDPRVPADWRHFTVCLRRGSALYEIAVENPGRRSLGVAEVSLDGVAVDPRAIPLVDDGATHQVRVVMGEPVLVPTG
jgi:cyclic beta-1,2-glucan synthetase